MMTFLKKVFRGHGKSSEKDFSAFFVSASTKEKADLMKQVVREANQDQKRLMDEVETVLREKKTARI
jgi:hypothetical protein